MSSEDNQQQEQPHQDENGSSNNVDVPEIELIIKVKAGRDRKRRFPDASAPPPEICIMEKVEECG